MPDVNTPYVIIAEWRHKNVSIFKYNKLFVAVSDVSKYAGGYGMVK